MAKTRCLTFQNKLIIAFSCLILGSCSTTKSSYEREYTRVWKEIIKSEAWKNSILVDNIESSSNATELYASTVETGPVEDQFSTKLDMEAVFDKQYNSLVSRAYFKIISEAQNADYRLTSEYERWNLMQANEGLKKDREFKKKYEVVTKKYYAHKHMLEGLKSWNIFSEFRSNDLDFFKAENREDILAMLKKGSTEDNMINYLVYRLADLYHYEDH